jgi:hypothetical protein
MMHKVIAPVLGAAALVVAPLTLIATPAFADPDSSQLCSQNADFGSACKEIEQQYPAVFNVLFKNLGGCVSSLNSQPSPSPAPTPTPTS